jgi:hypothetical protein
MSGVVRPSTASTVWVGHASQANRIGDNSAFVKRLYNAVIAGLGVDNVRSPD